MKQQQNGGATFRSLSLNSDLLASLEQKNFITPTPIQELVIPLGLAGKDIVGIAQTGTGKTLAFGIPLIEHIIETKGQGLILVPTRELALQVETALFAISKSLGFKTAVIIGGVGQHAQVNKLKANPQIVIATPGRLFDLMNQRKFSLKSVSMIVLDEADRMLDVGFLPQIKQILTDCNEGTQKLLFSATMEKRVESIAKTYLVTPEVIEIAPQGTSSDNVEQKLCFIDQDKKETGLLSILKTESWDKVLVFTRTKFGAKRLSKTLQSQGFKSTEIHGNRTQAQRKQSLDGFRSGRFGILVATDIAARGIDVKEIDLVINFDLPECTEDYVHRIGRTGRAGHKGISISFATRKQKFDIGRIEKLMKKKLTIHTLEVSDEHAARDHEKMDLSEDKGGRSQKRGSFRDRNRGFSGRSGGNRFGRSSDRGGRFERRDRNRGERSFERTDRSEERSDRAPRFQNDRKRSFGRNDRSEERTDRSPRFQGERKRSSSYGERFERRDRSQATGRSFERKERPEGRQRSEGRAPFQFEDSRNGGRSSFKRKPSGFSRNRAGGSSEHREGRRGQAQRGDRFPFSTFAIEGSAPKQDRRKRTRTKERAFRGR